MTTEFLMKLFGSVVFITALFFFFSILGKEGKIERLQTYGTIGGIVGVILLLCILATIPWTESRLDKIYKEIELNNQKKFEKDRISDSIYNEDLERLRKYHLESNVRIPNFQYKDSVLDLRVDSGEISYEYTTGN